MTTRTDRAAGDLADGSGKITRDAVLAAALEIVDRDGADALSMRRLARAGTSLAQSSPRSGRVKAGAVPIASRDEHRRASAGTTRLALSATAEGLRI